MYSRNVASLFFIAVTILFATLMPTAFALPAEPGRTVGEVVAENQNMACRMYSCFNKNVTATDTTEPAPAASTASAQTSSAASLYHCSVVLPAIIAGSSLLLLI